jgi:hypothetical protein
MSEQGSENADVSQVDWSQFPNLKSLMDKGGDVVAWLAEQGMDTNGAQNE